MLFKKKKDEFDFDDNLGDPLGSEPSSTTPSMNTDHLTQNDTDLGLSSGLTKSPNSFDSLHEDGVHDNNFQNQNTTANVTSNANNNEFQIMNAKLDAVKSELDALRQHILNIENSLNKNKKKPMW